MNAIPHADEVEGAVRLAPVVPLGHRLGAVAATPGETAPALEMDLQRILAGRLLIQGSSGAGKSQTLRRIVEEAFEYFTVMIVDPEGEFANLAVHINATTLRGSEITADGLTAAAARARRHRLALHLDLTDLDPNERIIKAAAFFAGLVACPREDWTNTVLVAIDEAHLLAPHLAASARDAETRRLGVATLTDLCARGRKRGIAAAIATQRLAKLATSVVSELHNGLIGLNVFDRDVARAADFLGYSADQASQLRTLKPGQFIAFGPALSPRPVLAQIGATITPHLGATPEIVGPSETSTDDASGLLELDLLQETRAGARYLGRDNRGGARALDAFLLDQDAGAAVRIVAALRRISPNATTATDLAGHLGLDAGDVDGGLDLLASIGAADTMPRGGDRIARLSPRLRLKAADTPVVGLA